MTNRRTLSMLEAELGYICAKNMPLERTLSEYGREAMSEFALGKMKANIRAYDDVCDLMNAVRKDAPARCCFVVKPTPKRRP